MRRRILAQLVLFLVMISCGAASAAPRTIEFRGLSVMIYDFGSEKLHAIATGDPLDDECFIFESKSSLVCLELPPVVGDLTDWIAYVRDLGKPVAGVLVDAHPAGGRFVRELGAKTYATERTQAAIMEGGATFEAISRLQGTIDGWERTIVEITDLIGEGDLRIGGMRFVISNFDDGSYIVEIPSMNAIYTHMFGADSHSLIGDFGHLMRQIGLAREISEEGYTLILSGHHRPEGRAAVRAKIDYLETMKDILETTETQDDLVAAMRARFPKLRGENYLAMTAAMIYAADEMGR